MTMELTEDDLDDIQNNMWSARAKWYNIGLGLRLLATDLDVIDKDKEDTDAKFRCMLGTTVPGKPCATPCQHVLSTKLNLLIQ